MTTTSEFVDVVEPATEATIASLPRAGVAEADEAVARAKAAYPAWRDVTTGDRAALLRNVAGQWLCTRQ